MRQKGPGRTDREGISIIELFRMFPDNAAAERWFEEMRWPEGKRFCPSCGSIYTSEVKNRKPMPYHCNDCKEYFSVRKGTTMQSSKLGYQKWVIAIYMMTTGIKGTSSMKIHRDLGISQSAAWHLMQRIREGFIRGVGHKMPGPVEVDETFIGGKRSNMAPEKAKKIKGRGAVGKAVVVGVKDRVTRQVAAEVVPDTKKRTLQPFIVQNVEAGAQVYTDDHGAYSNLPYPHEVVRHSVGEYVRGKAHTNGIESFWALMKRGYHGTYHKMSPKHLERYVREFEGRHNVRDFDTVEQMEALACGMFGRRLRYEDLIKANGLESGAREIEV